MCLNSSRDSRFYLGFESFFGYPVIHVYVHTTLMEKNIQILSVTLNLGVCSQIWVYTL